MWIMNLNYSTWRSLGLICWVWIRMKRNIGILGFSLRSSHSLDSESMLSLFAIWSFFGLVSFSYGYTEYVWRILWLGSGTDSLRTKADEKLKSTGRNPWTPISHRDFAVGNLRALRTSRVQQFTSDWLWLRTDSCGDFFPPHEGSKTSSPNRLIRSTR